MIAASKVTGNELELQYVKKMHSSNLLPECTSEVIVNKKGTFVDGQECSDVVEYRKSFLYKMVGLSFLNSDNAPIC